MVSLVKWQTSKSTFFIHPVSLTWATERLGVVKEAVMAKKALEILATPVKFSPSIKDIPHRAQELKVLPHIRGFLNNGLSILPFYGDQIMPYYQKVLQIMMKGNCFRLSLWGSNEE
jgi:hypothetical protein